VVRTVEANRRVQPVPWVYLAAALVGGMAGGALGRSARPVSAAAAGAVGGALACWTGFACTARGTAELSDDLIVAALQEVSPQLAEGRRRAHRAAVAQTATFPVYGPRESYKTGDRETRSLHPATEGRPAAVTSVLLVHGDPGDVASPWLMVTSSVPHGRAAQHDEETVAENLRQRLLEVEDTTADQTAVAPARWLNAKLVIDGQVTASRLLRQGLYWSVIAWVDDVQVLVEAHDVPPGLPLERMTSIIGRYT